MANRRKRKNGRVSGAARQAAVDRKKNLLKYALGSVAAVAIIALVIFGVASGTSSGGEGSAAPISR
ncbi:MAG: hypothetical protein CL902_03740 [Dehalococcoidia bacterium]|nr:hypothetical protein [Dehalococcoidia bacterium]